MSYTGDLGLIGAEFRPASEVEQLVRRMTSVRFVAPGSATKGQFGLFLFEMRPRAGGPDAHFHRTFSESFYVLAGTVRLFDGSRWVEAGAGDFLYVPQGGIHAFKNEADEAASMLILFAPGTPRERYFEELAEIERSGRKLSPDEWTALYARHDQTMV